MILVTGAGGMVGCHLSDVYRDDELIRTDLVAGQHQLALDVRDRATVAAIIESTQPAMVLHLAAETDVEACERNADHAYATNHLGTLNVALACLAQNIEMVYVSTAAVFDGTNPEPYTELDTPNPRCVYAKAKFEGEKAIASLLSRYYIVRAGWMFGGRERDTKFVGRIVRSCRHDDEILAVDDRIGNLTSATELLRTIRALTDNHLYGVYHAVNGPPCTRYDIAVEIATLFGKASSVRAVSSAAFPAAAPRARSEALRSVELERLHISTMRDWRLATRSYVESWNAKAFQTGE